MAKTKRYINIQRNSDSSYNLCYATYPMSGFKATLESSNFGTLQELYSHIDEIRQLKEYEGFEFIFHHCPNSGNFQFDDGVPLV